MYEKEEVEYGNSGLKPTRSMVKIIVLISITVFVSCVLGVILYILLDPGLELISDPVFVPEYQQ